MAVTAKQVNTDERDRSHVWDSGAGVPVAGATPDIVEKRDNNINWQNIANAIAGGAFGALGQNPDNLDKVASAAQKLTGAGIIGSVLSEPEALDQALNQRDTGYTSGRSIFYSDWSPAAQMFGMDQDTAYVEHMANTAHQRQVADLKAAGLNPVLGISGSGATSVSGNSGIGASSASKGIDSEALVDVIGATAGLLTTIFTKKPAYGYMVKNIVSSGGDFLVGSGK